MMVARVLVVDDDPATVELLQDFLVAKGYQVLAVKEARKEIR